MARSDVGMDNGKSKAILYSPQLFALFACISSGPGIANNATVCDLGALGGFVPLYDKTSIISLDVLHSLYRASDLVGHALAPFQFIGTLHEVPEFKCLFCVGADY